MGRLDLLALNQADGGRPGYRWLLLVSQMGVMGVASLVVVSLAAATHAVVAAVAILMLPKKSHSALA